MWPCRTQAAPRTARAPQEQPPPCLSCRNLPAPAPHSWTLPETSLQAACLHLGDPTPHTPPWGGPSTRAETSTPGCPPRSSMQAGSRQHQAGTTSWHRLCSPWYSCPGSASGWQKYVLLFFFNNKSGFSGAFCLHGSAGASASCGQRWKDALVTGCQALGSPPSAPTVLPQGVQRELGATLGSSYSWGWRGPGPVCPAAPCRTGREYSG